MSKKKEVFKEEETSFILSIFQSYSRLLGIFTLVFFAIQLLIHWRKMRWFWPTAQIPYYWYSLVNGIFFCMGIFLFTTFFTFMTQTFFLSLFLKQFKTKKGLNGPEKRSPQSIFLIIYFIGNLLRYFLLFFTASFAVFILIIGSLGIHLSAHPIYWLNSIPIFFFLYLAFSCNLEEHSFQNWLVDYIKPKLPKKEQNHEETQESNT